jgi:hypothetical protein
MNTGAHRYLIATLAAAALACDPAPVGPLEEDAGHTTGDAEQSRDGAVMDTGSSQDAMSGDAAMAVSCGCSGDLFVEVNRGGALPEQRFTSGDAPLPGRFETASIATDACSAPWAAITGGETAEVAQIYACASGGAPCVALASVLPGGGSTTGEYQDGQGGFEIFNVRFSPTTSLWSTHVGDVIEGSYEALLVNGWTLTGRFRVCVLSVFMIA